MTLLAVLKRKLEVSPNCRRALPDAPSPSRRLLAPMLLGLAGSATLSRTTVAQGSGNGSVPQLPVAAGGTGVNRFSDALAAPAISNARMRALSDRYKDRLSILDFDGVQIDGATDSTTAFTRACSDINANGRVVALPPLQFLAQPGAIQIGTGTASQGSTRHGGGFVGVGGALNAPGQATTIKAANSGGALATIAGITSGVTWKGILLDCDGKASIALDAYSVCGSEIEVIARQFTGYGFALRSRAPASSAGWCSGNRITLTSITSSVLGAYGAGVLLDGDAANNYDPHNNLFTTGTVQVANRSDAPVYGAQLRFCDSNTFIETDFAVYGAGNAGSKAVLFDGGSRSAYPQNNFFYGCSIPSAGVIGTIGTNRFINHTTKDGEAIPTDPKLIGVTDQGQFFGADLALVKDVAAVALFTADKALGARLLKNAGGGADYGTQIQQLISGAWRTDLALTPAGKLLVSFPQYSNDAAAKSAGLVSGQAYYNGTSVVQVA